MNDTSQLRPMAIRDLLDAAFQLYRRHFVTFFGIAALPMIPLAILQFYVQAYLGGNMFEEMMGLPSSPPIGGASIFDMLPWRTMIVYYAATFGLAILQVLIVQGLITGALAHAIANSYLGRPLTILEAYGFGLSKYLSLIAVALLLFFGTLLLALLLLGVPSAALIGLSNTASPSAGVGLALLASVVLIGAIVLLVLALIFFSIKLLLSTQAIVLEGHGPIAAMKRSWHLVSGSFWRTLLIVLLMGVIVYLLSGIPATVVSFALTLANPTAPDQMMRNQAIATLFGQLGQILVMPLQLGLFTLLYYDLRVRKEGFDLEIMAQHYAVSRV